MRRFYKEASAGRVPEGWQVALDGRAVKTVKGSPQCVASEALARALAAEWEAQGEKIDPTSLPLRDMTDYALDIVAADPDAVIEKLLAYGDTDTLLYRADPDEPLYARQMEVWEPIVAAHEARYEVKLVRVSGILHRPQDEASSQRLREMLGQKDPFALAALEAMASLAASLVVALAALDPQADSEALWDAASLEEDWQIENWGRDEEAEERRARRRADFLKACEFAALARAG